MPRTKLADRVLPPYTRGEEIFNMVSHIVGGGFGVIALSLCVIFSVLHRNWWGLAGGVIYGLRGLLFGLPAAGAVTYLLYRIVGQAVEMRFFIPWQSVVIAVGSVFAVVFATMLYSTAKIRRDNPVEALKTETL